MIKILLAEDEDKLRSITARSLKQQGYEVYEAKDGKQALCIFYNKPIDLTILDIMMPKMDGLCVCSEIREYKKEAPIILLTARNTEYDELEGFDRGADEYITKPFSNRILCTRIEALLKRCGNKKVDELKLGNLKVAHKEHVVYDGGEKVYLTLKEYDLLCFLVENKNKVMSREQIIESVWGYEYEGDERTIDTHIKCIRYKTPSAQKHLKTLRKVGYMYEYKD